MSPPRANPGTPHPYALFLWAVMPAAAWLTLACLPFVDVEAPAFRRACRFLGYPALVALLIPYLYPWRRLSLQRPRGNMTRWLRWHIGAAYLAFGLVILHGRGHLFRGGLTLWVVIVFALVLLSGMVGMALQRLVFRLLALLLDRELAGERLAFERLALIARSTELMENYSMVLDSDVLAWGEFCKAILQSGGPLHRVVWNAKPLGANPRTAIRRVADAAPGSEDDRRLILAALNELLTSQNFWQGQDPAGFPLTAEGRELLALRAKDLSVAQTERRNRLFLEAACPDLVRRSDRPPETVKRFFAEEVSGYLRSGFPSWGWLLSAEALEPVPRNHYLRARELAPPGEVGRVDQLWLWVEERRQMDLEYWFRRLTRGWLLVHAPAAWALLALVLMHVLSSIRYGGLL